MLPIPWLTSSCGRWTLAPAAIAIALAAGCRSDDPTVAVAALDADAQAAEGDSASATPSDVTPALPESEPADERVATDDAPILDDGATDADVSSSAPALCVRLQNPLLPAGTAELSLMVQRVFVRSVYQDCDVGEMIAADEDTLSAFENALVAWNLQFWGCDGQTTTALGIVRAGFDGVTTTDVARLVDHYVDAANQVLSMSPPEQLTMRQAFAGLVAMAAVRPSDQFTLSRCEALDASAESAVAAGDDGGAR